MPQIDVFITYLYSAIVKQVKLCRLVALSIGTKVKYIQFDKSLNAIVKYEKKMASRRSTRNVRAIP